MEERVAPSATPGLATTVKSWTSSSSPQRLGEVQAADYARISTGLGEFDRVLGGGLVPGSTVLVAGAPGVGKSTLLLKAANEMAKSGQRVLIVSGEESAAQIKMRADRTEADADDLFVVSESDLGAVLAHIEAVSPTVMIVDSIQTLASADVPGRLGSVSQVTEVVSVLVRVAKDRSIGTFFTGHLTKNDTIGGPRFAEHAVDVSMVLTGDRLTSMRLLRAEKNRFGSDEVGVFAMEGAGLVDVTDPSAMFLAEHEEPSPGVCVAVTLEGRRALLVEVQALTIATQSPNPRRTSSGLDHSRLAMVLAVLEKHGKVRVSARDVFASTIGGIKVVDPALDLALLLAVASTELDVPVKAKVAAIGEVALSGDVRPTPEIEKRVREVERRGFSAALVPVGTRQRIADTKVALIEVGNVARAMAAFRAMEGDTPQRSA